MRNYGPCGKCGKPMELFSHAVAPITWLGKPVCRGCGTELAEGSGRTFQGLDKAVKLEISDIKAPDGY